MTLLEGFLKVAVGLDFHPCGLSELVEVFLIGCRVFDGHSLVRPPRRDDLGAERMPGYHLVPAQVVGRVVGGADRLHSELADKGLSAELLGRELGVALLENLPCGGRAEELVNPEHPAEFEVSPVVERVAHRVRHGLRPLLESLPGAVLPAGEIVLRHAVGPHRPPLVVVSVVPVDEPELRDVAELDVLRDLLRHKMAVIVDDRHLLGVPVI